MTTLSDALPTPRIVDLSAGPIELHELGPRDAPPLLFVHGALVSASLWAPLARALSDRFRCILPTLPLGSHRLAMRDDAALDPTSLADLVIELAGALSLDRVTLVGNDTGGAISQLATVRHPARVERLFLTNCDALEVFPPPAYAYLKHVASLPPASAAMAHLLAAFPRLGQLPLTWGSLARRIDTDDLRAWITPLARDRAIRRDVAKVFRAVDARLTLDAAERLRTYAGPVRLFWGTRDPFFSLDLARRLAAHAPDSRVHEIAGARTYVMLDEPARLEAAMRAELAPRDHAPRAGATAS
jgi:pimeloyl-ACP methyl ester carboxylesterase